MVFKMWRFFILCAMVPFIEIFGSSVMQQHRYSVYQENMVIEEADPKLVDIEASVYKLNKTTNGLDLSFKFKTDLPEDTMVYAVAIRAVNGEYKSTLLKISKTVKSALQMEMFDLDSFFLRHTKPQIIWPFQKGVAYHSIGWSPDGTKFPPSLPVGEWKVPITIRFANKTRIFVATWYLRLIAIH